MALVIRNYLKVIRVPILKVGIQVHEDGLFFTLTVQEKLDIFVEVAPNFRFFLFVDALVASLDIWYGFFALLISLADA